MATTVHGGLAPVREVRVLPGDQVRKGQTLIVLDGDELTLLHAAAHQVGLAVGRAALIGEVLKRELRAPFWAGKERAIN